METLPFQKSKYNIFRDADFPHTIWLDSISLEVIRAVQSRYILEMIVVKLAEVAQLKGIKTAYQLQKITDFNSGMAYRLWKGDWQSADLDTLNTLCNALKCTPNDLLKFIPDEEF